MGARMREGRSVESLGVLTRIDMCLFHPTRAVSSHRPVRSPQLLQPPQVAGGGEQGEQVWGNSLGKGKREKEAGGVLTTTTSHLRLHKC